MMQRVPTSDSAILKHVERMLAHRSEWMPALTALAEEMPPGRSRRELSSLLQQLKRDPSACDLMADPVTAVWITYLGAATDSHPSAAKLADAIGYTNAESDARLQRRNAWFYPLVAIVIATIVLAFISLTVVPVFHRMFEEFGITLPASTRLLVGLSDTLTTNPMGCLLATVTATITLFGLYWGWTRYSLTTRIFGRMAAGNSASVGVMAKLTAQMAELLDMGASVPEALWFAGRGCGDRHFREVAMWLAQHAAETSTPLDHSSYAVQLPGNVIYALSAGSHGQPNTTLLRELSAMYRERVRQRTNWTSGIFSQFAIIGVALVVAFVMFALFMPLIQLVTGLS
ncbi:putative type II secretion system protein F [Novipirellula galeiformis]|uniref:Putative type II secretion system protein F n=2 Tax=Novipirellula galeiformis TaxID=2528004 RepID=A0A5C6CKI9_9BACT|nr:putative type II secretion system protein F [Novipirellula galeiformis]